MEMKKEDIKEVLKKNWKKQPEKNTISTKNKQRLKTAPVIVALIAVIITTAILFSTVESDQPSGPYGKIISPSAGSQTGSSVYVTAETRNLPPGQHVWLAVDKPDLGLCWPKKLRIRPNTKFRATVYEGGPNEPYNISLYVLNETLHNQWTDWIDRKLMGGLPMPPENRRLDTVKLLKKT